MCLRRFGAFGGFEHHGDQIATVFVTGGVVVDGAGCVGAVGEQGVEMGVLAFGNWPVAGDAPAQPVVWQADCCDLLGVFGFVFGDPCHLGQRIGGDGGGSHGLDPALLAAGDRVFRFAVLCRSGAELLDQSGSLRGGAGVVPQHGVANHVALAVENHHAVLLAAHGQCGYVVQSACLLRGLLERIPPVCGVDGRAVRVLGLAETHQFAGFGVCYAYLAGLRRGVDASHQSLCHGLCCLLAYAARRWRTANS